VLVAERTGRNPDDLAVRTFAGALVGVGLAAMTTWAEDPSKGFYSVLDSVVAHQGAAACDPGGLAPAMAGNISHAGDGYRSVEGVMSPD